MDPNDAVRIEHYRRWLRPDWRRWLHPDWERFVHPAQREAMREDFALRDRAFETPRARRWRKEKEERELEQQAALEAAHQREIEREALTLKADLAWLRFELAMVRHTLALRRKAFDPNQPRVPAGNNILSGRWTDDPQFVRLAASGKLPPTLGHNSGNFDIPPDRPEDPRERTGAIRTAAKILRTIVPPIARAAALLSILEGASWLREHQAEIETQLDPPKTLKELQDAVAVSRAGTQRHHVVEQSAEESSGFERSRINSPDNLIRIPKQRHEEISNWYSTKNEEYGGLTSREWLRGKSWEEHRALGMKKLIEVGVLKP